MLLAGVRGATLALAWEAAERDGSDAAGGGRSHLTGDHREPPGTETYLFLHRKLQRQTTNSHPRVVSRVV
jgi:hypothetical protein